MKKVLLSVIIIVMMLASVLLFIDNQSKQGIINDWTDSKSSLADDEIESPKNRDHKEDIRTDLAQNEEKEVFTIVIDPGHQKKANLDHEPVGPGATETKPKVTDGTTGVVTHIPEYELTLEASLILQRHLEEKGFDVVLTRTNHEVNISNRERAQIANDKEAALFLRIHADGAESPDISGFSLLIPSEHNHYTKDIYKSSFKAAEAIIANIEPEITLLSDGIFPREDLSGFNWSEVPVILVELGFMTNPEEDKKLADEMYLTELTQMIADGVESFVLESE